MDFKRLMVAFLPLLFFGFSAVGVDRDSLGIEREADKIYVLHRVDSKETLFSLSRRYQTSVESIVENNQINDHSLAIGSVLRIPWLHSIYHMVEPGQTLYAISKKYDIPVKTLKQLNNLQSNNLEAGMRLIIVNTSSSNTANKPVSQGLHVVAPEETLYSISRKYQISIEQLRDWNQLEGNTVRSGDTLLLEPGNEASFSPAPREPEVVSATTASTPSVAISSSNPHPPGPRDAKPVSENGIAAVIDGTTDSRKYLALHPNAPVGTIMRVRNEMTNLSVFVRVVGRLPATGANNNVLIRLSPAAQEALGALDDRFRVELSYVPNQ